MKRVPKECLKRLLYYRNQSPQADPQVEIKRDHNSLIVLKECTINLSNSNLWWCSYCNSNSLRLNLFLTLTANPLPPRILHLKSTTSLRYKSSSLSMYSSREDLTNLLSSQILIKSNCNLNFSLLLPLPLRSLISECLWVSLRLLVSCSTLDS